MEVRQNSERDLFGQIVSLKSESVSERTKISVTLLTDRVAKFLAELYSSCGQLISGEQSAHVTQFARGKM